jgi:hypothetical protein
MPSLAALLMIAALYWGQTPDCGRPTIEAGPLPTLNDGTAVVGYADIKRCSITIDPRHLTGGAGSGCMVAVHEYKHLLRYFDATGFTLPDGTIDHSHSPYPDDLMFPRMGPPRWPCRW